MRLLVTGIPGSGKTTIGDHLRDHHDYMHIDIEALIQSLPPGTSWATALVELEKRTSDRERVVLTWGFIPGQDEVIVRELQRVGYALIWFDGDCESARRA